MTKLSPHITKILLPIHLLLIYAIYEMVTHWTFWFIPITWFVWFLIGGIGVEIGLHRLYSHKTFTLISPFKWVVGLLSVLGGQWSPVFWSALHRGLHHPMTDTKADIHSPIHGYLNAYIGWIFKLKPTDVPLTYAKDLLKDPMHKFYHKHYVTTFWYSILILGLILGPVWICPVIVAIILAIHQEFVVNLFCHLPRFGYQNFATNDNSRNIHILGLLFWGQGYHNNHHARPKRYNFAITQYEFDICKYVVPMLIKIDKMIDIVFNEV